MTRRSRTLLLSAVLVFPVSVIDHARAADPGVTIGNYQLVSSQRVTPSLSELKFRATLTNGGGAIESAVATMTTLSPSLEVVDGELHFGSIGAGGSGTSLDTFTIRTSRSTAFNPSNYVWHIDVVRVKTCGDTAGPGGTDVPCSCGDTVVTNTQLVDGSDPVVGAVCDGNGLLLAPGMQLDLNSLSLRGKGTGTGISIANGGQARQGTVNGFGLGIGVGTGVGNATVLSVTMESNTTGAIVDVRDAASRVVFDQVVVQNNTGDGIHVLSAPGASNLDDPFAKLTEADYGFVLTDSSIAGNPNLIRGNGGNGIHLGDAAQGSDVAAMIRASFVSANFEKGLVLEQKAGLAQGVDCGASGSRPGCSGVTVVGNVISNNGGAGVELRAGFIIPFYVPAAVDLGLGFVANEVAHNAMPGPGCQTPQSEAQIRVTGPVGLSDAVCASAGNSEAACNALPANNHCIFTNTNCVVAWDLRGDTTTNCNNGMLNAIFDYNTSDTGDFNSVGMRAEGNTAVYADNNVWRSSDITQNYSQAPGSFIRGNLICSTRGTCLSAASASLGPATQSGGGAAIACPVEQR